MLKDNYAYTGQVLESCLTSVVSAGCAAQQGPASSALHHHIFSTAGSCTSTEKLFKPFGDFCSKASKLTVTQKLNRILPSVHNNKPPKLIHQPPLHRVQLYQYIQSWTTPVTQTHLYQLTALNIYATENSCLHRSGNNLYQIQMPLCQQNSIHARSHTSWTSNSHAAITTLKKSYPLQS